MVESSSPEFDKLLNCLREVFKGPLREVDWKPTAAEYIDIKAKAELAEEAFKNAVAETKIKLLAKRKWFPWRLKVYKE